MMHSVNNDSCGDVPHGSLHEENHVTVEVPHACDDEEMKSNERKATKAYELRPCSCLQEGAECKCGSSSNSRFSVRLEPWACYKTFLMSGIVILIIVWIICFLTLMKKNAL